ncbi:sporulation protein [Leptolyngbya sp. 7M]|uniref:sporulation protein n=1 Tax=Leptolyngbya sp. 7M TaxID=2812896 RepID=UPI001B8C924B|nr:sporulation protein [Leptolyngbya sp. 7M]QYO63400.1 sporulation protein [Leptolyngbya sp. 7M]
MYAADAVPGETLEGEVHVIGGAVAQTIEQIYFYVATKYKRERNNSSSHFYQECKLLKHRVTQGFTIQPQEEKLIPVAIEIPYQTPLTLGQQEIYIRTGLDIAMAINPKDWDDILIRPHPLMKRVLDALELLGFYLYQSDCEYNVIFG